MTQKHSFYSSLSNRHEKKRGSVDNVVKPDRRYKNIQHRQAKKQMTQLTIDLNTTKNPHKISINRNFTHRQQILQNNNLCDLRQQVQQLRMQNESLRDELKLLKSTESQQKLQILSLKNQSSVLKDKQISMLLQQQKQQQKLKKYSQKIKQLFQLLILQKRRNAGINNNSNSNNNNNNNEYQQAYKIKMALSPSNLSICNSLNLRKYEQEGFRDFYNSAKRKEEKGEQDARAKGDRLERGENYARLKRVGWSLDSSESQSQGFRMADGFTSKY